MILKIKVTFSFNPACRHNFIKMIKILFSALIVLSFNVPSYCQESSPATPKITDELKTFFSQHVFENVYLQFDKPYYAAGDTIYFKAYVTEGPQHTLSEISSVLHVDLINPFNKIDQSIELYIDSGLCWGDFSLPDVLPAGNYRIRAYTNLMRNNGEMGFFDKTLVVGSLKKDVNDSHESKLRKVVNGQPDIQFFPEGGNLITGIRTKVAFKAVASNGIGTNVKGEILDSQNQLVSTFASKHLGMGDFFLLPEKDQTYKAKLTFEDGSSTVVQLPKPGVSGITLAVNDSASEFSFTLAANQPFYKANRNKDFLLLFYSGGKTITYSFKLEVSRISLDFQKRLLHSGVATVTLFSPEGLPLCERLFFVRNEDQLQLEIKPDKTNYTKREKVRLILNERNMHDSITAAHFSVSVIDESKVPGNENNEATIMTDLLLTSEVKGYVEQPAYYFNDTSDIVQQNLDVLMLTQGFRRFQWEQVMDTSYTPLAFQAEKSLEINGKVTDLSGRSLPGATINLIPSVKSALLTTTSDENGLFHFSNLVFMDTTHFVLSAVNSIGDNSTKITYFNKIDEPPISAIPTATLETLNDTLMSVYLGNAKKVEEEYSHFKGKILTPVKVKGKLPQDNQYRTQSLLGAGNADQVMHADEIERVGGQLSTSLNGRLHGVGFNNDTPYLKSPPGDGPMIVVLDGSVVNPRDANGKLGGFNVNTIPSSQVETIEVLKYASASIYGMEGGNGVLIITSKKGGEYTKDIPSIGVLPIAPKGFYIAKEFYSPKYDYSNANSDHEDLRSTIYWNPEIKTDNSGNASFDYYNADGTGTYKVTVEGIDDNGKIGRTIYRYKVE